MSEMNSSQTPAIETLEIQRLVDACQTVSTEAFAVADIGKVISERLPKLSAALKDAFRFMTTWDFSRPEGLNAMSVSGVLRKNHYTDIENIRVAKPVAFTGNLHQYCADLHDHRLKALLEVRENVLKETRARFAYYLNELDNLDEKRVEEGVIALNRSKLEDHIAAEAKWHIEGNRSNEANFGDLFDNNKQCIEAMTNINEVNKVRWQKANPKDVQKDTQALVKIAEALFDAIKKRGNVSKAVLKMLAQELELAGRWVEWYSVQVTRIIDTTTALKHTEKTLIRIG
jgi:hypothetical protein